ncbi:FAD-binding protein [Shigella flexneri]
MGRRPDGSVNVRRFGGMKSSVPWFAADTPASVCCTRCSRPLCNSRRSSVFDEHFVLDISGYDGHVRGLVAMNMMEGTLVQIRANAVVMATGGVGGVYR